jgi:hypothetical protein
MSFGRDLARWRDCECITICPLFIPHNILGKAGTTQPTSSLYHIYFLKPFRPTVFSIFAVYLTLIYIGNKAVDLINIDTIIPDHL